MVAGEDEGPVRKGLTFGVLKARYAALPGNMRGALWMLLAAFTFTLSTTLVKYLGDDYSPALQTFYRNTVAFLCMLPIILRNPRRALATNRLGILLFRSGAGTIAMVLTFYAYQKMPLADANALSFTRTLWLVPLAAFFLREHIGPRRIAATVVGFLGVLVMVQPGGANAHFGWPAMAMLTAAFLLAFNVAGIKLMTKDNSTLVLTSWAAVLGLVAAVPLALVSWRWPTPIDLALLVAMGVFALITQACYLRGMAEGDAAAMSPLDYTRLPFAVLFGFLLFHEIPNPVTLLGAAIVIGSTLYITLREAQLGKKPAVAPAEPS
ncbi:MAG: DMT family transporter [Hyphomonadaceae bacterium]